MELPGDRRNSRTREDVCHQPIPGTDPPASGKLPQSHQGSEGTLRGHGGLCWPWAPPKPEGAGGCEWDPSAQRHGMEWYSTHICIPLHASTTVLGGGSTVNTQLTRH